MAFDKLDQVLTPYSKAPLPSDQTMEGLRQYLDREFSKIELILSQLSTMAIISATAAPRTPMRGMVRYARTPWNPLGTGDGWVRYNGTTWIAL